MADPSDRDRVSPTARWIVHGAWKIAIAVVIVLIVAGIITAIQD